MPFAERWRGVKPSFDLIDAKTGEVVIEAGKKITAPAPSQAGRRGLKDLLLR
jgi:DNA-directed RNA polymerase subunit beta